MFQYDELIAAGFTGFKTVKQMNNGGLSCVTESQGVYMILYLNPNMRFGQGKDVGHKGGRYIWQIPNSENLVVCWKPTQEDSRTVEAELIQQFVAEFGKRPFANLSD